MTERSTFPDGRFVVGQLIHFNARYLLGRLRILVVMSDTLDAAWREGAQYNRLRCRRFSGSGHIGFSFIPETGRSRATCTWNESQISASFGLIPCVSLKAEASAGLKSDVWKHW